MPSFLFHFLNFALKPISADFLRRMLSWTHLFLERIESFPELVLAQLVWIYASTPDHLRPTAVDCVLSALRFEEVRQAFPPEFWKTAVSDFANTRPIFEAFTLHRPTKYAEMILALRDLSAHNADALRLLVAHTEDPECARLIISRLPIDNRSSPTLLFQLYSNLALLDGASFVLGEDPEFYMVCRLVISLDCQAAVCRLIRAVALDPILLESSELLEQVAYLITITTDRSALWNLLSVVFAVSRDRFFRCLSYIIPNLRTFVTGDVVETKTAAFLCLTNMFEFDDGVDLTELALAACEIVDDASGAVQSICCDFLTRVSPRLSADAMIRVVHCFLAVPGTPNPEFAAALSAAASEIEGFDSGLLRRLATLECIQK
jgi:hypothetical protein